jgi:hypothetical protein
MIKKAKKMAEGGEPDTDMDNSVSTSTSPSDQENVPVEAQESGEPDTDSAVNTMPEVPPPTDATAQANPQEADNQAVGDTNPQPQEEALQQASFNNDETPTVDVVGNLPPAQYALQRTAEDQLLQKDMETGKVNPKTYSDLFANKSTLGKIGTIFGLMLSGAGSGLTGQHNMLMEMMNKEIDRDLESQKTNQANKHNWYTAALQHEMNAAQIATQNAVNAKTMAGTYNDTLDAAMKEYGAKDMAGVLQMPAVTLARNSMRNAFIQTQQDHINRLAPGPAKDNAQGQLNNLKLAVYQKNSQDNMDLANKRAAVYAANPHPLNPNNPKNPEFAIANPINQDAINKAITIGKISPNAPSNVAISQSEIPIVNQEITNLKYNRNNYSDLMRRFKRLEALKSAGQVPAAGLVGSLASKALTGVGALLGGTIGAGLGPLGAVGGAGVGAGLGTGVGSSLGEHGPGVIQDTFERERNTLVNELMDRVGVNRSESAKVNLINSMFPAWNDTDDSLKSAWEAGQAYFRGNPAEAAPTLSRIPGAKTDFPNIPFTPLVKPKKEKKK